MTRRTDRVLHTGILVIGQERRTKKNGIGSEARTFSRCRPREVSERLDCQVALQDIDPVARLHATDEREHLVRCKVEGVQRETELGMFDERKEAERAVVCPLQDDGLRPAPHDRFDERRPFANAKAAAVS